MSDTKERLDVLLVKKGIFNSRERARASIMAGEIFVDGQRVDKCGENINVSSEVEFRGQALQYVSRGGLKLEKAMQKFDISLEGKTCIDIGASTGGFTDCMLQNGAVKVFAVDVGYGQLAWKLRTDPRVVCLERTNIRYVTPEQIGALADFASIDVSFISLSKVIKPALSLLTEKGAIVALIKPQFEAGREKVGKKGVVKEKSTHIEVITNVINFIKNEGLTVLDLDYSPIKGPEGNIEYLVYFTRDTQFESRITESLINETVEASHGSLV